MIRKLISNGRLFVYDADSEWNGVDYPYGARMVWQSPMENVAECKALESFYDRMKNNPSELSK